MSCVQATVLMLALAGIGAALAQDHSAAPMMAPARSPLTEQGWSDLSTRSGRISDADSIVDQFRERFPDRPRIAVLWHQALSDRVSDWYGYHRTTLAMSGKSSQSDGKKRTQQQGNVAAGVQSETRGVPGERQKETSFALRDGLIGTFQSAGASMVDEGLARRLSDNALEDGTFSRLSPDQLRLQMRALAEYADYVLELTAGDGSDPGYRVRVLSTENATVVTTFSTTAEPPESEKESHWVATSSGYQKRDMPVSLSQIGRELALLTMERMRP
ncbi:MULTISPECIES: hypothetical protein [Alloalcanivorax]|nr:MULTISPECIES: hypothetical protein [Alloalcanivorax]MBF1802096.1 hypothetical protein [Alloalcanivorax profundimaris]GGJ79375.1 hypothetical protein GCM10007426_05660 [Alloalcanivorax dieselolei]SOC24315.1 hypothetical protein SAMN05877962_12153 [Alloalcanivorax xenomutans]